MFFGLAGVVCVGRPADPPPINLRVLLVIFFFFIIIISLKLFLGDGTEIRFSSWIVGTKNESPVEHHFSFPDFLLFCVT